MNSLKNKRYKLIWFENCIYEPFNFKVDKFQPST